MIRKCLILRANFNLTFRVRYMLNEGTNINIEDEQRYTLVLALIKTVYPLKKVFFEFKLQQIIHLAHFLYLFVWGTKNTDGGKIESLNPSWISFSFRL